MIQITTILVGILVLFVIAFIITFPIVMLWYLWKLRKVQKEIPDKIKEKVFEEKIERIEKQMKGGNEDYGKKIEETINGRYREGERRDREEIERVGRSGDGGRWRGGSGRDSGGYRIRENIESEVGGRWRI